MSETVKYLVTEIALDIKQRPALLLYQRHENHRGFINKLEELRKLLYTFRGTRGLDPRFVSDLKLVLFGAFTYAMGRLLDETEKLQEFKKIARTATGLLKAVFHTRNSSLELRCLVEELEDGLLPHLTLFTSPDRGWTTTTEEGANDESFLTWNYSTFVYLVGCEDPDPELTLYVPDDLPAALVELASGTGSVVLSRLIRYGDAVNKHPLKKSVEETLANRLVVLLEEMPLEKRTAVLEVLESMNSDFVSWLANHPRVLNRLRSEGLNDLMLNI